MQETPDPQRDARIDPNRAAAASNRDARPAEDPVGQSRARVARPVPQGLDVAALARDSWSQRLLTGALAAATGAYPLVIKFSFDTPD